jgi:hypothetical protein
MNQERWIELLENQNEATRYHLIGSGIVCGLQVSLGDKCSIHLTKGIGLTSCGLLISLSHDLVFRYYRTYQPADDYPVLWQKTRGRKPLPVWELIQTHEEDMVNALPLAPQTLEAMRKGRFVEDKVLLIFLEPTGKGDTPDREIITVSRFEYNDSGAANIQRLRMRFLLMTQEDVLNILRLTPGLNAIVADKTDDLPPYGYGEVLYERYKPTEDDIRRAAQPALSLEKISLRRFPYGRSRLDCEPGQPDWIFPEIKNLDDLFSAYVKIIDEAISTLSRELRKVKQHFHPVLTHKGEDSIVEYLSLLEKKWTSYRESGQNKYYIQYFYGWMRDLYQAYNELREELTELVAECGMKTNLFPRHILIGKLKHGSTEYQPSPIRSHFRQPPIYNGNADRLVRVKMYHWRILMMIRAFYLPDYTTDPTLNPYCGKDAQDDDIPKIEEIRITPSPFYDNPLGEQAIPFYYPLSSSRYSVHRFWNYQYAKAGAVARATSYFAQTRNKQEDNYTDIPSATEPLIFNLNHASFYRIEGHIGKNSVDVTNKLTHLKQKYNIHFLSILFKIEEMTQTVTSAEGPSIHCFKDNLLGMEYLGGVREYGTLVLIVDQNDIVLADFSLPHRQI